MSKTIKKVMSVLGFVLLTISPLPQQAIGATYAPSNPPNQSGFPLPLNTSQLNGSDNYLAGVATADLNLDGKKEIIFGNRVVSVDGKSYGCGGKVYAIQSNGVPLWVVTVRGDVNSSPAISDLNGDGYPDVVVGMGAFSYVGEDRNNECGHGNPDASGNGGVVALDGRNGNQLWVFNTQDRGEWGAGPNGKPANGVLDGVIATPAIVKLRPTDEFPVIAFGAWDNCIYLLDHSGNPTWGVIPFNYSDPKYANSIAGSCGNHGFFNHDTVWSSPAFADVDGDGVQDVIVGGDSSAPNFYQLANGGIVWVIKYDGTVLARAWLDQGVYSSPAVADLDNDGKLDIVVGTGEAFCDGGAYSPCTHHAGRYVIAYNYDSATTDITQRLKVKWKSATIGPVFAAPAIGDINQDGILDVVTTAKYDRPGGSWTIGSSLEDGMYLYAMNGNDGTPLTNFPVHMCETTGRSFPTRTSAIIADIAGDSKPEILFSFVRSIGVVKADGTYYSAINVYGTDPCQPFNTRPAGETSLVYGSLDASNGTIFSTPAVDDIDSDGDNEVIAIGIYNQDAGGKQGDVLVWTGQKKGNAPWPMFRGNISRTGALARAPHLSVSPTEITLLHQIGQTDLVPFAFTLSNVGGGILDWRYTGPTDITPSTISGSLSAQTTLSATINSTSLSKGIHTRTITVDATNGTAQAQGSPVTVTLTIKVVDEVFQVHLPVAVR